MAVAAGVKIAGTAGVLLAACLGARLDPEEPEPYSRTLSRGCGFRQSWLPES